MLALARPSDEARAMAKEHGGDPDALITLTLCKHRNGPTGEMRLRYDRHSQRFLPLTSETEPEHPGRTPFDPDTYNEDGPFDEFSDADSNEPAACSNHRKD